MEEQVLSVEQMQELIGLGIDTSKATCYWLVDKDFDKGWVLPKSPNFMLKTPEDNPNEYRIDAFTLQDILEKVLPKSIIADRGKYKQVKFYLRMQFGLLEYSNPTLGLHTEIIYEGEPSPLLHAAFRLLKWCKENNHI